MEKSSSTHIQRIADLEEGLSQIEAKNQQLKTEISQLQAKEQALRENELRFHAITQYTADAIISTNAQGEIQLWNHGAEQIFGCTAKKMHKQSIAEVIPDLLPLIQQQTAHLAIDTATPQALNMPEEIHGIHQQSQQKHPLEISGSTWTNNQRRYFLFIIKDITECKKTAERLELAKMVFDHAKEAIIVTDHRLHIIDINPVFTSITGFSREEVLNRPLDLTRSGRHGPEFFANLWKQLLSYNLWSGEIWDRRKDGELFPSRCTLSLIEDREGNPANFVGIFSDISDIKATEARLTRLAYYDALTELPNRLLFRERLTYHCQLAERSTTKKVALMFIDLDRFKYVNDTFGHDAGDQLLIEVSQRIKQCLRKSDTVARLGGDEFTVILPELKHQQHAATVAEKIITSLSKAVTLPDHNQDVFIGASIGIAFYPRDGKNYDEITRSADTAMYHAKEGGRGNYRFFTQSMNEEAVQQMTLDRDMRTSLKKEEFFLVYQPKVAIPSGHLIGMESLIRWRHPHMGIIPPDVFITLAEENGLIIPLGEWVLEQACQQNKRWLDQGMASLRVAVNLSARQLQKEEAFIETLKKVLHKTALPPEYLELEITESMVMEDVEKVIATLKAIKALGIYISMDDFGTGYSSLNYLKRLPIDALKIDKSFVRELSSDSEDAAIVTAIISMADSLNLNVVAEGVETPEQLRFLTEQQCEEVQGYYFSPPVPQEAFTELLEEWPIRHPSTTPEIVVQPEKQTAIERPSSTHTSI
ncbi:sensor domain-containing protein [Magnetococcales bacterium HHB-1]